MAQESTYKLTEKVIQGLNCCVMERKENVLPCDGCPYTMLGKKATSKMDTCLNRLMTDAITVIMDLKAKQAICCADCKC